MTLTDTADDCAPRRSDPGGDGPFDPTVHRLIDLLEIRLGEWAPVDPSADLFTGDFVNQGRFVRLDLILAGLVNPPGDAFPTTFDPFAYGAHPIYGFIEIDVDDDVETGGELDFPEYRYLANAVRFGGKPSRTEFADRVALDDSAFDQDITTAPFVDRHGEEFHVAFLGGQFRRTDIIEDQGDGDWVFEVGESWIIRAPLFHRAHGYEPFSLAEGGTIPGEYAPICETRFSHDDATDETTISLVFPLTNVGAAEMLGQPQEGNNHDPSDQASVLEALTDLRESASFLFLYSTGLPEEDIILRWRLKGPGSFLDPTEWAVTALLGTVYTQPDPTGEFFIWTDIYPDVTRGDVNGDNVADLGDRNLIDEYIMEADGSDGILDESVAIPGFAAGFAVQDVNHDGVVNAADMLLVSLLGDTDGDADADLEDFALFQNCFLLSARTDETCPLVDCNGDGEVDLSDLRRFRRLLTGPRG